MATLATEIEDLGRMGGDELALKKKSKTSTHLAKENRRVNKDNVTKKGIGPKSPTVYLLPEEKEYLAKLQGYITYTTGKRYSDHELIIEALHLWVDKNHKEFNIN